MNNIIWHMRFECRITKATDTHSEYVILITFFTAVMVIRTRLNVMFIRMCPVFVRVHPVRTGSEGHPSSSLTRFHAAQLFMLFIAI
jgi:hypothetical protein